MQRIVKGLSATLQHTFYVDGVATNPTPDTATVGITRDNGTVLVASGTAATEAGTGVVTYTLTPAQTALLDILTVSWTATFGGQSQTFPDTVEVAGGVLFAIADARALSPLNDAVKYTTQRIVTARTVAEGRLESRCAVAFVPRYARDFFDGTGGTALMLPPRTTAIRSVKVDGVAVTDISGIRLARTGRASWSSGWASGDSNYEIAYEHGFNDGVMRMEAGVHALTLAKHHLVHGPIDDRATNVVTEDASFALATPGMRGSYFGLPDVDAFVNHANLNVAVA